MYGALDFVVVEQVAGGVEGVRPELVGRKGLFPFLCFLFLLALPLDIVLPLVWIADVLDGLEVVADHSRLYVSLQLTRLRLHSSVF